MPWTALLGPEAVMWGLVSILAMIGDGQPISFLTYASGHQRPRPGGSSRSARELPCRRPMPGTNRWR